MSKPCTHQVVMIIKNVNGTFSQVADTSMTNDPEGYIEHLQGLVNGYIKNGKWQAPWFATSNELVESALNTGQRMEFVVLAL